MQDPRAVGSSLGGRRRPLLAILAIVFVDLLGFGIVIPILPFYVRDLGGTDVVYGLLAASYSLMQFVFAPLLGQLSDARGRRPVLMLSLSANTVAWVVFGLGGEVEAVAGTTAALATLFLARMLAGAMGGNIATAQAYIADVTPAERRAGALGLVGAAFGLGFVFGPALGSVLASDGVVAAGTAVFPDFVPATRFSLPSFGAAVLSFVAFLGTWAFLPEPDRHAGTGGRPRIVGQFVDAFRDATLAPLVGAFLVASVAFSGIQVAFIPFVADVYGYDASQAGLLLTYVGALAVVNQGVLVGRLSRVVPARRLAVAGAALLVVALAAFPFSPEIGRALLGERAILGFGPRVIALLGALTLLSLGNSLLNVSLTTLVSLAASADRQGGAFGVTQGAGSLGRTVGPPIMTALYAVVVYWSPFVLGAVLTLGIVAVLTTVRVVGDPAEASVERTD
ncbi:major facilitator superfamily protein [Halosimplex carlsbadense 2-9-1]|uniref:Major facilitator superfamily protein n=1 Tax=Halosimplex carlsbadense 2-9-1 TaxID=797114 RepID=M0CWT7_9EURY|nr:MFS transporter [Halosimplex carlsbadense]ELZ27665.1 major facilitator superfamily protein [Halosimplex carlsbadense 2-9-1]